MDSAQGQSEVKISEVVMWIYHCTLLFLKNPYSICMWLCQTDPQQSKAAEGGQ